MKAKLTTLLSRSSILTVSLFFGLFYPAILPQSIGQDKPNVLFIAIDDMNDWTGFLGGHPQAITPNMDKLAERGVNFSNAHCVAPACSPSRNALLFGIEPYRSGLYPFYHHTKMNPKVLDKYVSIPQLFKEAGYHTFGSGKIHHGREWTFTHEGGKREWTENNQAHLDDLPALVYDYEGGFGEGRKMAFCPTKSPLEHHPDYATAMYGKEILGRKHKAPFFLALGFVKPHLPFVCPKDYFDLYPHPIQPPAINPFDLEDISWVGRSNARLKDDFNYRQDDKWQKVHRAYLACNSWTDANIGRVIDALNNSPYKDNTIIVLWSDHGYHQGEKRSFRKFSLWEEANRVPFIIVDPRNGFKGECKEAVSLQDIYPTLTELAGLQAPEYLGGENLVPWLKDPAKAKSRPAITTWGRGNYSIRSRDWRYIRYFDGSEELYHHPTDPQEWTNLASKVEYKTQKEKLAVFLPQSEAKLVIQGKALHNVVDADQTDLAGAKSRWKKFNQKLRPPLDLKGQEKLIHILIQDYAQARENRDTLALKSILIEDIDQLVSTGEWRRGLRTAVQGMQRSSTKRAGSRSLSVEQIRFLNPEHALVDCRYTIKNDTGSARKMWSTFVLVYRGNNWKISAIRNMLPAK